MAAFPVISSLNLSSLSTSPSPTCLQWSSDGQAILLTQNAVYILTPDLAIGVNASSVLKQTLSRTLLLGKRPVGWFRTIIERPKSLEMYSWATECQEWGAISFGSLDPSLRAVVCSPSNITSNAGSLFAILDSNMEIALYKATKNHYTGEWNKIGDLNDILADTGDDMDIDARLRQTLCRQSTCMAWSPQADFGISPSPDIDGSILAIGNRAGSVTLLRYNGEAEGQRVMQHLTRISVGDRWVTRLSWSRFTALSPGNSQSYLACALADGSIIIVKIIQSLAQEAGTTHYIAHYNITVSPEIMGDTACHADRRDTTSLQWIDVPDAEPVLVFSKPGVVHVWPVPAPFLNWTGLLSIALRNQKLSVGSTAFSQTSGIAYSATQDTLIISLADGSFHAVRRVSKDPAGPFYDVDMSENISKIVRSIFVNVKEDKMTNVDMNTVHGMVSYDGDSTLTWMHEDFRPTDFNYKHEARRTAMMATAQLWEETSDEVCLEQITSVIIRCARCLGDAPLSILRPTLLHLRDPARLARIAGNVLELLKGPQPHEDSAALELPQWSGELTPDFREQFQRSLRTHLFGRSNLLSQRLRIALASYCQKQCEAPAMRDAFSHVAVDSVTALWHRLLRIIIRHIVSVLPLLTPSDVPFVLRIVVQAMLPGTPPDLEAEAESLAEKVQAGTSSGSQASVASLGLAESCPACHTQISLTDIATATCPNGHIWPRCSITSFILSTPMVRTCMSCSRKAFLPPPQPRLPVAPPEASGDAMDVDAPTVVAPPSWLPPSARSWVVEDLLRAVRRCFVCGGNFVTLV